MILKQNPEPIEILLVEDSPDDAELTVEALKSTKMNYHLRIVEDGEQAMQFLRQEGTFASAPRPGLIILDLKLPRKDGREVLAEIKSDPELRRIPVIVLTTSQAEKDILNAYDKHANCYITKPLDLKQLLNVMKTIEDWLTVVKLPTK